MTAQPAPAPTDELRLGALIVAGAPAVSSLPLEHTDVVAQVCGPLASVSVTQRFGNPFAEPVELAYLFPLPHEAAVVDYELRIGQRVIRAEMQEIEAARRTYAEAREAGKRAGLVEQRRPNLFSVELANVQPGETITATVRYQERLRYDDGDYQFVFPMGVTPKFHADMAEARNVDAPIAGTGAPIGRVELSLAVDAGGPAGDPHSPSHAVDITRLDQRRFSVRLLGDVLPNKDFVLRYAAAEDAVRAAAWAAQGAGGATVLVTALPPRLGDDIEPAPREFVFVIDRSGSMSGGPLLQARNALRACLRALGEQDTFNIQAFDNQIEWLSEAAAPVTQAAVEQADRWLGQIDARGGTDILGALDAALQFRADHERQRYVVFLTDGAVSAEDEALRRVERQLGQARLFTFGIGPSVNRALLARMAELGHGTAEFLQLDQDIEAAIVRFQDRVAYPVLQDLQLAWQGGTAWDIYPARLPDLYIGQPLELVARFQPTGSAPGRLTISGRRGRETVQLHVDLPPATAEEPIITRAWASARVTALLDMIRDDSSKTGSLRGEIIGLAIQQRLLTPYTAFVAVDSQVAGEQSGQPQRVQIAVPLPEGLDIEGFIGGELARGITGFSMAAAAPMAGPAIPRPAPAGAAAPARAKRSTGEKLRGLFGGRKEQDEAVGAAFEERIDLFIAPDAAPAAPAAVLPAAPPAPEPQPEEPQDAEEALRWLARNQNVSGSWGRDADEVEMTAAALLAFVRAGHTTRAGHYRRQLAKALKWLLGANATGAAAQARAQALAELAAAIGDAGLQQTAQAAQAGLPAPSAPPAGPLTTLEALRAAALTRQRAPVAPELLGGTQAVLARVWQAALVA
jgi:Ca-activated chloride channel family protein